MTTGFEFPIGPQRIICMTEETTEWFYATQERKREIAQTARKRSKDAKEANRQRTMISLDLV